MGRPTAFTVQTVYPVVLALTEQEASDLFACVAVGACMTDGARAGNEQLWRVAHLVNHALQAGKGEYGPDGTICPLCGEGRGDDACPRCGATPAKEAVR